MFCLIRSSMYLFMSMYEHKLVSAGFFFIATDFSCSFNTLGLLSNGCGDVCTTAPCRACIVDEVISTHVRPSLHRERDVAPW